MYAIINKDNNHVVSRIFTYKAKALRRDVRMLNNFCCRPKYQLKRIDK